ncbi:hypothetical protein BC835DRAFT_1306083 [Cytidiella melzeri]|nr:hypothetical protein BC835DRAFT_1306083 [Cytidiella melzeri]
MVGALNGDEGNNSADYECNSCLNVSVVHFYTESEDINCINSSFKTEDERLCSAKESWMAKAVFVRQTLSSPRRCGVGAFVPRLVQKSGRDGREHLRQAAWSRGNTRGGYCLLHLTKLVVIIVVAVVDRIQGAVVTKAGCLQVRVEAFKKDDAGHKRLLRPRRSMFSAFESGCWFSLKVGVSSVRLPACWFSLRMTGRAM